MDSMALLTKTRQDKSYEGRDVSLQPILLFTSSTVEIQT